jgi:adenylosuccinate synthase
MGAKIYVIVDLGYGDSGKGTTIDFLARKTGIKNIVRYNGGAQAAHHVMTPDGRLHCFTQFGSATFVPGTRTLLSRFMYFNPLNLEKESEVLQSKGVADALSRLWVDKASPIVTPFQVQLNRLLELSRGDQRHGSCGFGVGQTVRDHQRFGEQYLFAGDLADPGSCAFKVRAIWQIALERAENLIEENSENADMLSLFLKLKNYDPDALAERYGQIASRIKIVSSEEMLSLVREEGAIFEAAQGLMLDQRIGFYPHVTSTNTTLANAELLIGESGFAGQIVRLGLSRAYATRHGAGPFATEDNGLEGKIPACHNNHNIWQGAFRLGWFDLPLMRYALEAVGPLDGLVITNLDRLAQLGEVRVCRAYLNQVSTDENLSAFFSTNRIGEITALKQPQGMGREEMKRRTRMYNDFIPVYESLPEWTIGGQSIGFDLPYVQYLERELGSPMVMLSAGPTASDKITIPRFL